jgi:hypothetical protein
MPLIAIKAASSAKLTCRLSIIKSETGRPVRPVRTPCVILAISEDVKLTLALF